MAATPTNLRILNAASKTELKLVKRNGHYHVNNEVLTGDLYRDETNPAIAILVVVGTIKIEELTIPEITKPTLSNGG